MKNIPKTGNKKTRNFVNFALSASTQFFFKYSFKTKIK